MIPRRRKAAMPVPSLEKAFAGSRGWKRLADVNAAEVPDIRRWMTKHGHERGVWSHPNGFKAVVVRHAGDLYARAIHQPLDIDNSRIEPVGYAAERAALVAASGLGLPDLVFKGAKVKKGNASREVGDGTIISGNRGLAIQSKARSRGALLTTDKDGERSWVTRQVKKAANQASGSIRSIDSGATLENYRGRSVDIGFFGRISWVRVVILDHPAPPEMELSLADQDLVVITRRDWEFLFRQLMSTSGVVDYLHRIAGSWPSRLGEESNRYYELALADLNPEPAVVPAWVDKRFHRARPRHSMLPASEVDVTGINVYRHIIEIVATASISQGEAERIRILSALDQLPAEERATLGQTMMARLKGMRNVRDGTVGWRVTRVVPDFAPLQLCFAVTNLTDAEKRSVLISNFTSLRHAEFSMAVGEDVLSVVVTVSPSQTSPRRTPGNDWDCTVCVESGGPGLDEGELARLRTLFGVGGI
jgi:hypothetical protein